ncbi:MAG: DUF420 domain-containing protein [Candidatus Omnitrophota bacterium]|nr:DUF420 domain-containing protein [Candidatus Omnitrophota bacterium]MDZ4242693.1 DUF420 domain-containing protein [Candidatus Omnitrophota bacterium]
MTQIFLPSLNACLNGLAAVSLVMGWLAIRQGKKDVHRTWMLLAFACSILFLGSYVTYHVLFPGVTRYQGQGILRPIYYIILLTHTVLAVLVPPMSVAALWHAFHGNFKAHVRITRWFTPVWLYVSITGVVIYLMLYIL